MRKDAEDVVEEVRALEKQSTLACVYCKNNVTEPYWCCMDCGGESV